MKDMADIINKLEPEAFLDGKGVVISAAISLKRIADAMTGKLSPENQGRLIAVMTHKHLDAVQAKFILMELANAGFRIIYEERRT